MFPITPKAHSNSSKIFSYDLIWFLMKKSFNIQELLHHKSKCHGTKPMHPSLSKAFKPHQEHNLNLKHPGSVDLITTKQNKLASFIDRFCWFWSASPWFCNNIGLHDGSMKLSWNWSCCNFESCGASKFDVTNLWQNGNN